MMKSFNCSKNIINNLLLIFKTLSKTYYAHLSKDKLSKETLLDHSLLVSKYCLKLMASHQIDPLLDSLIERIMTHLKIKSEKDWGNLFKEIFFAAIIYHDMGKVNTNFQIIKMENEFFSFNDKLSFQSNHSLLGAYLFSNIYFKKTSENNVLNDDEKLTLYFSIHLFSSTIIKHHNQSIDFSLEFEKQQIDDCYLFLKTFNLSFDKNFCSSFYISANVIFDEFKEITTNQEVYFELFATTKLLYSLLTASDFYATNEFMTNIEINEFGILNKDEREKLTKSFKTVKYYNKDLYENFVCYQSFPLEKLTERNASNLNLLRQKLTVELITNLRKHSDHKCFYLEAPTGAGKTNLSLAFATELMNVDSSLNKVFYVFPFTTLITQTFVSIKETLEIDNNYIIQLHSKAGFHEKDDGTYGDEKQLYLDNLFVNYPIVLMSHILFFNILKGNEKESNYLLHRLCNSIVIIDEIHTYNPEHWDKIVYFLANYAQIFNIRVLIMSATLPKIDVLHKDLNGLFVSLITNRKQYFSNENFAGRILFDFSMADKKRPINNEEKETYLRELSDFIIEKTELYVNSNNDKVKALIEFITKKTAAFFFTLLNNDNRFKEYKILLLSGDILEFRRKQIINAIKEQAYPKVILVSTQVVEAGVDIDMDIGFKDRSLIDSDEQLAGRINRNASKENCIVYLFDCDKTSTIYGSDSRYKIQQTDKDIYNDYKDILNNKEFHALYEKVFEEKRKKMKSNFFAEGYYYKYFKEFNFPKIHTEFMLIEDNDSQQLFIPIQIPILFFDNIPILEKMGVLTKDKEYVDGMKVFEYYEKLVNLKFDDFSLKQIELKKIGSIMSQFSISVYQKQLEAIADMLQPEKSKYGFQYLLNWDLCYSPDSGFDSKKVDVSYFI
ncbi:MAG: CRISPR-associated helicase Cas3' [Bacteroidales bacterium]|nr:CRISPR-associated helicase Cas3' [Bacteroidales bacterium]